MRSDPSFEAQAPQLHVRDISMNNLANSLVTAIRYIESRSSNDTDADISALEEIAILLQSASEEEKNAFSLAAQEQEAIELPEQLGLVNG